MRKHLSSQSLLLALLLAVLPVGVRAQQLADYQLSTSQGSYESIASTDRLLSTVNGDGGSQTVTLPFGFPFGEQFFAQGTTLTVRADGYIYFGTNSPGHYTYNAWTASQDQYVICPLMVGDGKITASGATSGAYALATVEAGGDSVLVIEWKGLQTYGGSNGNYNVQLRLYADGRIAAVYGSSVASNASGLKHTFLVVCGVSDKVCLTGTWASFAAGTPVDLADLGSSFPALGTVITWSRPTDYCARPENLVASNATPSGLTLRWNAPAGGSGTTYNVYVDATLVASNITDTFYVVSNLVANTGYTMGVQANCPSGSTSTLRTVTCRTACEAVQPLPYVEDFDSYIANSFPACWSRQGWYSSGSSSSYTYPEVLSGTSHSGSQHLRMYYNPSSINPQPPQFAISPALPTGDLHVKFWGSFQSIRIGEKLMVGLMSDNTDTNTFVPVLTIDGGSTSSNTYSEYELYTDVAQMEGPVYLAFKLQLMNSSNNVSIDDLLVEEAPACRQPLLPEATNITYEGTTLRWQDNTANGHVVRYGRSSARTSSANQTLFVAEGNSVELHGLSSLSIYYAWVATVCGTDTTEWVAFSPWVTEGDCYPVTNARTDIVTLNCATVVWDYDTDHGREATAVDVSVVDMANTSDTTHMHVTGTTAFLTGLEPSHTYRVLLRTECGTYNSNLATVTFATLDCGKVEGQYGGQFGAFNGFNSYGYSQTLYPASLLAQMDTVRAIQYKITSRATTSLNRTVDVYMANTFLDDLDTNTVLDSAELVKVATGATMYVGATGWTTIEFDSPYVNDGSNVVVAIVNRSGNASANAASFQWGMHEATVGSMVLWRDNSPVSMTNPTGSGDRRTTVPDISFLGNCDMSGCQPPLVAATEVASDHVTLSWAPINGETLWTAQYRRSNDTGWTSRPATSDTTMLFSNMLPATAYSFRVGSICGSDTVYSDVVDIHTRCSEMELPFREGFEEWSEALFPSCWSRPLTSTASNKTYPMVMTDSMSHSGTHMMALRGTSNAPNLIATSEVPSPSDQIHVEFWARQSSTNNNQVLEAGLMSDPSDASTFVPVLTLRGAVSTNEWQLYEFYSDSVALDGPVHVAFRSYNSSTTGVVIYIDDVMVNAAGNCRRPVQGSIVSHTYHDVTLQWVPYASTVADDYTVRLTRTFDSDDSDAIDRIFPSMSGTVDGLEFATLYHVWVSAQCDGTQTDWLYVGNFVTDEICAPVTALEVTSTEHDKAVLAWSYDAAHGTPYTGVNVMVENVLDSTDPAQTFYSASSGIVVDGLQPGTTYRARVQTICSATLSRLEPQVYFTTATCAMAEGTGSSSITVAPVASSSSVRHSYSQFLYPDSIADGMDTLRGIAFHVRNSNANLSIPVDIYIGNTDKTYLTRTNHVQTSQMLKVANQHLLDVQRDGWVVIPFDTAYAHSGVGNLVVTVVNNSGLTAGTQAEWYSHNGGYATLIYCSNTSVSATAAIDPDNLGSVSQSNNVPDVMFLGECLYGCTRPMVVVDGTDTDRVSLSWMADDDEEQWTVGIMGDDGLWLDSTVQEPMVVFEGLRPSSPYTFRVGRICTASDTLFTTLSAYTACASEAVPFVARFEAPLSPCWTVSDANEISIATSSHSLCLSRPYNIAHVVLPQTVRDLDELQLSMYFQLSNVSHSILVGITDDNGATITWVDTLRVPTAHTPVETVTTFIGRSGSGQRIVLAAGNNTYYAYIDSLRIDELQVCFPVDSLVAHTNIGRAYLEWHHAEENTTFQVTYKADTAYFWDTLTVGQPSATLTGLAHATGYTARVRPLCTSDTGRWESVSFVTPCDAVALPFETDFEELAGSQSLPYLLPCWGFYEAPYEQVAVGNAELSPMSNYRWSTSTGQIDGHGLQLQIYGDINNVRHWAVMPAVDVDDASALIAFDYKIVLGNPNNPAAVPDNDDRFLIAASTDGGRQWQTVASWGADAQRDTFSFVAPYGVVHHVEVPIAQFLGDTVRFAFYGQSTVPQSDFIIHIDNLRIGHRACPMPTNVGVSLSGDTATLVFDATHDAEVAIVEGSWTDAAVPMAASASQHLFTGLVPGATYTVGVRQECEPGYYSQWDTLTVVVPEEAVDSCEVPVGLAVVAVSPAQWQASWQPVGTEALWQLHIWGGAVDSLFFSASPSAADLPAVAEGSYDLCVRAVCDSASQLFSLWSDTVRFVVELPQPDTCPTPTAVVVTGVEANTAILAWQGGDATAWQIDCNGIFHEAASNTFTLTGLSASTTYSVRVRALCDDVQSEWSAAVHFTTAAVGIDDVDGAAIRLYPNPASTIVTIEGIEGGAVVTIVDMNGRTVREMNVAGNSCVADISGLPQGAYFVRITGDRLSAIRKLVVR